MAEQTTAPLKREQLEEIYMMVNDLSFQKISKRSHFDVFDTVTAPTAHSTTAIVTAAGTMEKAINTAANWAATKASECYRQYRIPITCIKNTESADHRSRILYAIVALLIILRNIGNPRF